MELWVLLVHVGIQLYRPSPHRCPRPSVSDLYRSKFSVVATPHVHSCPSLMVRFRSSMPRMLTARRLSKKSTAPLSVQTATKCLVDLGFAEPRGRSHRSGCPRSPPKKNITVQRVSKAAIKQGICYCLGWVQRVQIPSEEVLGALGLQFLLSSFLYSFRESLPHHIPVEVGRSVGRPPKVCNEIGEQLQRGQAAIYKRRKYKSGL